jgi:hypothetical protein
LDISLSCEADASNKKNKSTGVSPIAKDPPSSMDEYTNEGLNPTFALLLPEDEHLSRARPSLEADTTLRTN